MTCVEIPIKIRNIEKESEDKCLETLKDFSPGKEIDEKDRESKHVFLDHVETLTLEIDGIKKEAENKYLEIIKNTPYALEEIIQTSDLVLAAVKQNAKVFEYVLQEYQEEEVCLAAVRNNLYNLFHIEDRDMKKQIMCKIFQEDPCHALKFLEDLHTAM